MAKCIHSVRVTNVGTAPSNEPSEALQVAGVVAEYTICDVTDPQLRYGKRIALATVDPEMKIEDWWGLLITAIKTAEGIA